MKNYKKKVKFNFKNYKFIFLAMIIILNIMGPIAYATPSNDYIESGAELIGKYDSKEKVVKVIMKYTNIDYNISSEKKPLILEEIIPKELMDIIDSTRAIKVYSSMTEDGNPIAGKWSVPTANIKTEGNKNILIISEDKYMDRPGRNIYYHKEAGEVYTVLEYPVKEYSEVNSILLSDKNSIELPFERAYYSYKDSETKYSYKIILGADLNAKIGDLFHLKFKKQGIDFKGTESKILYNNDVIAEINEITGDGEQISGEFNKNIFVQEGEVINLVTTAVINKQIIGQILHPGEIGTENYYFTLGKDKPIKEKVLLKNSKVNGSVIINKAETQADMITPKIPEKIRVNDKTNLTDTEKIAVKKAVEDINKDNFPIGTILSIGKDGTVTITYPDKSTDDIKGINIVEEVDLNSIIGPFNPADEYNKLEIPESYIIIKFNKGDHGKLLDNSKKLVDEIAYGVNPDANLKLEDIQKAKVKSDLGYKHAGWDVKDEELIEKDMTVTAQYIKIGGGTVMPGPSPGTDNPKSTPPEGETDIHKLYVIGYPNGYFFPENNMTRAEVAMIFARLLEDKLLFKPADTKYSDVRIDHWASGAVDYLTKKGILHGMPDGKFYPENKITRAEYATIIANVKKLRTTKGSKFTDIKDHWAEANIEEMAEEGIILGYGNKIFKPDNFVLRAEAVTMTNRAFDRIGDRSFIEKDLEAEGRFSDVLKAHWAYTDIYEAALTHKYVREKDNSEKWIKITELGRVIGMKKK